MRKAKTHTTAMIYGHRVSIRVHPDGSVIRGTKGRNGCGLRVEVPKQ
jgi:hypothetical protein